MKDLDQPGDDWLVTLFLVNDQEERASRRDEAWLFQAELAVFAGGEPVFVRRRLPDSMIASPDRAEARTLEMAYRDEVPARRCRSRRRILRGR